MNEGVIKTLNLTFKNTLTSIYNSILNQMYNILEYVS